MEKENEVCPNPKGIKGICYAFDRYGDRCGCIGCSLLETLPNGLLNEGNPLPGLTKMLKTKEYSKMVSNYLKEYFKKKNVTQYEIAEKIGISQSKINLSFNNKRKLTIEELLKIAIGYDIDLNKLKEIIRSPNSK